MQSEEREKLRKQAVTLIRSLLISSKGGVPIEKLNRDYREMIGKFIPWRDLGYISLEEFLDQSPDMCRVAYTPTGIMVRGVVTSADAHVASLVSRQSSSKKRSAKTAKMPPARRPNTMRPWQPPTPSQPFQRQSYNRFQQSGRPPSNRPGGSGRFPVQNRGGQNVPNYQHQQRLRTPYNQQSSNANQMNNAGGSGDNSRNNQVNRSYNSNSAPMMNNRNRQNNGPGQQKPQQNHQFQRPAQDQQQSQSQQSKPNSNNPTPKANQVNSIKLLEQYFSQNNLGELTFKTASVEVKSGGSGGPNQKNGNKGKKITKFVSTVKVGEQSFQTFPNSYPTKEQAEEAASSFAISKLNISSSGSGPGGNSGAGSNSNNNSVMSMPIGHFEDPGANGDGATPETEIQDIEPLIDKICGLVGNRYNGVWSTQVDVEFKRKYGKTLPEKWPVLIEPSKKASKKLRVDNPIEGRYVIYPIAVQNNSVEDTFNSSEQAKKEEPAQDSANIQSFVSSDEQEKVKKSRSSPLPQVAPPSGSSNNVVSGSAGNNQFSSKSSQQLKPKPRPPKLTLPDDSNWYVYITCVHSTVNVCLRLLGDAYSSKFDDMVTNMELKYFESDQVPSNKKLAVTEPEVGTLYAAKVEGDWHRVEATNVHGLEVTCYFIDHGDEDLLKVKDLRQLLPEFMALASQAKSVRLAGLEDLAGDQNAQAELTDLSLGRSLVAQVHALDESGIALILYDTNSDEDININEKILEKFRPASHEKQLSASSNNDGSKNGASPPRLESPPKASTPQADERREKSPGASSDAGSSSSTSGSNVMQDLMSIDLASLKPLMPTNMTECGEFLDVNITLAASPSNFTVQPWQNTTQLESFQAELNSFYSNPKNQYGRTLTQVDVAQGDKFYAGQHMDGEWYRVKVNATIDEVTVAAKIVDFGDFTMIPLESLQPLWPQFRNLPMQAISASLADIVATNGDWSTEDTIWFSERVVNNQFVTKIRDVTYDPLDDNVRISVSLIDTTHPTTDIYIEKQLVEEKRAVYLCV